MNCPNCKSERLSVIDSRPAPGMIKRRRKCDDCGTRFSTVEIDKDFYEEIIERPKTEVTPLDKRTAEIIMVCKGQHDFGIFPSLKQAVAAYLSDRCSTPAECYTYSPINKAIWNAALTYLDSIEDRRPSSFIRKVKTTLDLHNRPLDGNIHRIDEYEAICIAFQTEQTKNQDGYVNGFSEENTQFVHKRK